nr:uncharacterized protein LOC121825503 [Peromyscus maniculatus bairdii]
MVEPPQLAASSNSRGHPGPAPWTHRASPQPSSEVRGAACSLLQPRVGTTDRLMTEKVLRRQIISTVSSSVGYFNILCLCKRHNGTRHKLTPSRSSGTSWRDAGELSGFEQLSCLQAPAPSDNGPPDYLYPERTTHTPPALATALLWSPTATTPSSTARGQEERRDNCVSTRQRSLILDEDLDSTSSSTASLMEGSRGHPRPPLVPRAQMGSVLEPQPAPGTVVKTRIQLGAD